MENRKKTNDIYFKISTYSLQRQKFKKAVICSTYNTGNLTVKRISSYCQDSCYRP
jgi:hypothetical protein